MPDREKVINGLIHCTAWSGLHECQPKVGDDCPYEDEADCQLSLMRDALALLKEQEIIRCKDCKYGLYTGTEYLCDRHSGHVNRFGEDQYYKEWHNGNWYCADGERR